MMTPRRRGGARPRVHATRFLRATARTRRALLAAIALSSALAPALAHAQGTPIPGSLLPGRNLPQQDPTPLPRGDATIFPTPTAGARPSVAPIDPRRSGRVDRIALEGSTVLDAATVERLGRDVVGRVATARELVALAERLSRAYVERGYVLSEVLVPDQDLANGVVRLVAVEGHVAQVLFRATDRPLPDSSVISGYGARIVRSRPLERAVLERNLLLMNEVGDAVAIPTLRPSPDVPGAWDLEIELGRKRASGNVALSNRGSRWLGPARLAAELHYNSDFLGGARTSARVVSSVDNELNLGTVSHEQHLGASGAKVLVAATSAYSRPDLPASVAGGDLVVRSSSASAVLAVPIVRGRDWNLAARAGWSGFRGTSTVAATRASDDRIDAARIGIALDGIDRLAGVNLLDLEGSFGRVQCGESTNGQRICSRPLADGERHFARLNVYAARLQSIAANWSVLVAVSGQYAADPLPVPEQFGFGGEQFGRAFDQAELLGDSGFGFKAELRRNGRLPIAGVPVTAYAFLDAGRTWRHATAALGTVAATPRSTVDAQSVGTGLRVQLKGSLAGYAEVAKPLGLDVASVGNRNVRVFGGMSWSF